MSRTPGGITCAGGISSPRSASCSCDASAHQDGNANDPLALARDDRRARDLGVRVRERPRRRGRRHGAREPPGARRPRRDHARVLVPRAARRLPAQPAPQGAAAAARRAVLPARPRAVRPHPAARRRRGGRDATCSRRRAGRRPRAACASTPGRSSCTPTARTTTRTASPSTPSATATRPTSARRTPTSRAYARALVADVCRYDVGSIFAESLHYHPVQHGHEHERYLIELGTKALYLLGLCFCEHCLARAAAGGVDGESVRAAVRDELERAFAAPRRGRDGRARAGDARGRGRRRAARLPRRARPHRDRARRRGCRGRATRRASASSSWIRPARSRATGRASPRATRPPRSAGGSASTCPRSPPSAPRCRCSAYAADVERVRLDLEAYRAALGDATVSVVLRPIPPDCETAENLAAKLALARELGLDVGRDLPLRLPPPRDARPGPRRVRGGVMRFDLLIKGGEVVDPGGGYEGPLDIAHLPRPDRRRRPGDPRGGRRSA